MWVDASQDRPFPNPMTPEQEVANENYWIARNVSDQQFAEMFDLPQLACVNKFFLLGQCFAGGFIPNLMALPHVAALAASPEDKTTDAYADDVLGVDPIELRCDGSPPGCQGTARFGHHLIQELSEQGTGPVNMWRVIDGMRRRSNQPYPLGSSYSLYWFDALGPLSAQVPSVGPFAASRDFHSTFLRLCAADIASPGGGAYRDGFVTIDDLFGFLNLWFAGDPIADFGAPAGVDINDIFIFLNAWFAGC